MKKVKVVTAEAWYGLLTRQSIIDQLVHTAALAGYTSNMLGSGADAWDELALRALGLDDDTGIMDAVIKGLGEQGL